MGLFDNSSILGESNSIQIPKGYNVNLGSSPLVGPRLPDGSFYSNGQTTSAGQVQGANTGAIDTSNVAAPNYGVYGGASGQTSALQDLEAEYNANLQAFENQKAETQGSYNTSIESLNNQSTAATNTVKDQQSQTINQLGEQAGTTTTTATNALNDARRAYNELQQRNNANLSASGLGSSSVAEALGEQLSRTTFDTFNQITQNRDTVLQNIEKEKVRANDFYSKKQVEISQALQIAQKELQNELTRAMNRIEEAKTLTTVQKNSARTQILQGARAAYAAASAKAAENQQILDTFNQTRQDIFSTLGFAANGKIGVEEFASRVSQLNQKLRSSGLQMDVPTALAYATSRTPVSGGSLYTPYEQQPPVLGAPGMVAYDPETGKQR